MLLLAEDPRSLTGKLGNKTLYVVVLPNRAYAVPLCVVPKIVIVY